MKTQENNFLYSKLTLIVLFRLKSIRTTLIIFGLLLVTETSIANDWIYTVRPGDNLWNLSEKYLTSMKYLSKFQQINQLNNPRKIQPGTKLHIPIAWLKLQPESAKLIHASGEVTIIRAPGDQPESQNNEVNLYVGDQINTGANGSATLEFADKSRLLLQSNTKLIMDTLSSYGDGGMIDTRLRLPAGRVDTQVNPTKGPATRFEITTPAAIAAVRGTDFRINADHDNPATRSEVLKGIVDVAADNTTTEVPAGFGTVSELGKPPIKPRKLLPPPNTDKTVRKFEQIPLSFKWSPVVGAQAYRVQIFPENKLDILLVDKLVNDIGAKQDDLIDGSYILRVRAIDDIGLEGLNRDHMFTVNARPFSPDLLKPINNTVVRNVRPQFEWSKGDGAETYNFQLARDEAFSDILIDSSKIPGTTFQSSDNLPNGLLFWRVASLDNSGIRGPFSQSHSFQVRPLPAIPHLQPPQIDKNGIYFEWDSVPGNVQYHFQFATHPDFDEVDSEKTLKMTKFSLPRPESMRYYYRIRTINERGDSSPFSQIHQVNVPPLSNWPMILILVPLLL